MVLVISMLENQSFFDRDDYLSKEDIAFLNTRLRKQLTAWLAFGCLTALGPVVMSLSLPNELWLGCLGIWVIIALIHYTRTARLINHGKKRVVRGEISDRFKLDGGENSDTFIFIIQGKRIEVSHSVYKQYFKRDIAEFQYLPHGLIFKHTLLKRGKKEYAEGKVGS